MKLSIYFFCYLLFIQNFVFGQEHHSANEHKINQHSKYNKQFYDDSIGIAFIKPIEIQDLEIPKTNTADTIITHYAYSLIYSEKHEQAKWVAYELTHTETISLFHRINVFLIDPLIHSESANNNDYKESGYDRGHLAPAADMGWSEITMKESFYYSNMSPQLPSFNRGIWKQLEEQVRAWAKEYEKIYIVTGPILMDNLKSIGANKVSVPKSYYKVILDYSMPIVKGIGFILPNEPSKQKLESFAVTIDSVEKVTGINFFYKLPKNDEVLIEKVLRLNAWSWNHFAQDQQPKKLKRKCAETCLGITKKGNRCKNKTCNASKYCLDHESQFLNTPLTH